MLRARFRADLKVYKGCVDLMEAAASKGLKASQFDKLTKDAAHAQEAFVRSRDRFRKHVSEHGCE